MEIAFMTINISKFRIGSQPADCHQIHKWPTSVKEGQDPVCQKQRLNPKGGFQSSFSLHCYLPCTMAIFVL